jgi:hypothetical protein
LLEDFESTYDRNGPRISLGKTSNTPAGSVVVLNNSNHIIQVDFLNLLNVITLTMVLIEALKPSGHMYSMTVKAQHNSGNKRGHLHNNVLTPADNSDVYQSVS